MKLDKPNNPQTTVDAVDTAFSTNILTETSLFGETSKVTMYTGKTELTEATEVNNVIEPTETTKAQESSETSMSTQATDSTETLKPSVSSGPTVATEPSASTLPTASTESTDTTASTQSPKPTRIGKQQRRLEFAEYKEAFLSPKHIEKRHQIWVSEEVFQKLEYYKRVLGYRETTVTSYGDAIILAHFNDYSPDLEAWRKL